MEGLPATLIDDHVSGKTLSCVEARLLERETEFSRLGFIQLCPYRADRAVFFSVHSCQASDAAAGSADAAAQNRLRTQLQYILTGSRFMQYLRALMESVGVTTQVRYESILNAWIQSYVRSDGAFQDEARFPLQAAQVILAERMDMPGVYLATAFLTPAFQMEAVELGFETVIAGLKRR